MPTREEKRKIARQQSCRNACSADFGKHEFCIRLITAHAVPPDKGVTRGGVQLEKVGKVEKLISACLLVRLAGKNLIIFAWQPMQIAEQNIKVRGRAWKFVDLPPSMTKAGEYLLSSRLADQQKERRKTTRKLNDRLLKWKQLNALEMVRNAGKLLSHDKPHQPKVTKGCLLFTSFLLPRPLYGHTCWQGVCASGTIKRDIRKIPILIDNTRPRHQTRL